MHEHTSRDNVFWNKVAAYIDRRDLEDLRREWNDAAFADVAMHVTSCLSCLERRVFKVKAWTLPSAKGATDA
jgi:hypothetical protein